MKLWRFLGVLTLVSGAACSEDQVRGGAADGGAERMAPRDADTSRGAPTYDAGRSSAAEDASSCAVGVACAGECSDGRCLVSLARNASPSALAVDTKNIYFARCSAGSAVIITLPREGGSPRTLASLSGCPVSLAATDANLFIATATPGAVLALSLGSDAGRVATLASSTDAPIGLTIDGANVYFTTAGGSLLRVAVGGGATTTLVTGRKRLTSPVVDETGVYFGDPERGTIEKVPPDGGAARIVTSGVVAVSALALSPSDVYFGSGYLVMKAPRTGGAAVTLGTAAGAEVLAVAVDATSFYFSGYGSVWKMSLTSGGGPATFIAAGQSEARAIVLDDTSVYWVNDSGAHPDGGSYSSTVMRLTPK